MGKYLVAFDFDHTTIEDDSDWFILHSLSPSLLDKMKTLKPTTQWTDLCHLMVSDLHQQGFSPDHIKTAIRKIPFDPDMKKCFEHIKSKGHDIIIISDANTVYIDEISKEKEIHHLIDHVITNKGYFDESGKLNIEWFSKISHGCPNGCSLNICKGKELLSFLETRSYDKVFYVGDGSNDFCPLTKIKSIDYAMPRDGMGLEKLLKEEGKKEMIQAQIKNWKTAGDALEIFKLYI